MGTEGRALSPRYQLPLQFHHRAAIDIKAAPRASGGVVDDARFRWLNLHMRDPPANLCVQVLHYTTVYANLNRIHLLVNQIAGFSHASRAMPITDKTLHLDKARGPRPRSIVC
jgi:hypothetical protein